jgi:hypothetical protein
MARNALSLDKMPLENRPLQVTGYRLQVTGYRLQVLGEQELM